MNNLLSSLQNADTSPDTFDVYNTITAGTTGAEESQSLFFVVRVSNVTGHVVRKM